MQIVNVVEIKYGDVNRVFSFSEDQALDAERKFLDLVEENTGATLNSEDREFYLDEGCYSQGEFQVNLVWSKLNAFN